MADKVMLVCPDCGHRNPDSNKYCSACSQGLSLADRKAKNVVPKWKLEATPSGRDGKYQIAVQVTKNGSGENCKVWVGGVFPGDKLNGNPITGDETVIDTKDDGSAVISLEFEGKERRVVLRVQGCQADTGKRPMKLRGPKPKAGDGGFWSNLRKTIAHNRGEAAGT